MGWRLSNSTEASSATWLRVGVRGSSMPAQGWKLHVSSGESSAGQVLARCLPVLFAHRAPFKVAASLDVLHQLNWGLLGLSQIGKFLTAYPRDDQHAVSIALALDRATRGLRGPRVPSDRRLSTDGLVHYRYGSFVDQFVHTAAGNVVPAVSDADGVPRPDLRLSTYHQPEHIADPFASAGLGVPERAATPLINRRYLVTAPISESGRGTVSHAVDLVAGRQCIVKRARRDGVLDTSGRDARDRLRNEADVLRYLAPEPRVPAVFDLLEGEDEGDLILVLEYFDGETLEQRVRQLADSGRTLPCTQLITWARQLAQLLEDIHAHGIIHGDLKSSNVVVTPDEQEVRLVDFDLASSRDAGARVSERGGTPGYISPEQAAGGPPSPSDDVYGLGALLFFMATGAEPSQFARPFQLLDRPLATLNPALPIELRTVIERCLARPAHRFASIAGVDQALSATNRAISAALTVATAEAHDVSGRGWQPVGERHFCFRESNSSLFSAGAKTSSPESEAHARIRSATLAQRLTDTLCQAAQPLPDGAGLTWHSTREYVGGVPSRDVYTGSAGVVLALADLVPVFDHEAQRAVLVSGARALLAPPVAAGEPGAGLYVGEAGLGAALLRAGQTLGEADLVRAATRVGQRIAARPFSSFDLMSGAAGRLRFHLWLWDATGDREHLDHARQAGAWLVHTPEPAPRQLGYAHGAAGIADALLDLYEATGDDELLRMAQKEGRWLASLAMRTLDDESGVNWPAVEGEVTTRGFWCHGAAGIGRFFAHASALGALDEAADLAAGAARTAARGYRWSSPTQCHGLAGNIELLLDMFQTTADATYLHDARTLANLLEAWSVERDGRLMWPSESPRVFTPDYMVGYAGVAMCLLRLADPARRPHQLSRRGFQFSHT